MTMSEDEKTALGIAQYADAQFSRRYGADAQPMVAERITQALAAATERGRQAGLREAAEIADSYHRGEDLQELLANGQDIDYGRESCARNVATAIRARKGPSE
jgi:hypothetical protein